ncbi:iron chelate uptake ABC transporter family permease subunit [Bacillus mangrovi]|uniref:Iron chelate uptake ABC transporter family permease subunit n=1 Tax=Metabacillus mangrovi TaxID=1491830 RepID=A0A7X2V576_9BACI|nr:iron ABC transporter permease [Metabacillus mangrovi]MTH53911.1 iron chelate uptake ABC transporter family permease subunit [Metabacillus mangrovi]
MLFKSFSQKLFLLIALTLILVVSMCSSIVYGYARTDWALAYQAFTEFNGSNEHIILTTVRLPRALIAALVGASLAIAGAIMQALTKNPLASPGVFGINAGAGFFVVAAVSIFHVSSLAAYTWLAFLGAAAAAFTVYFVGAMGREGLTPVKLTLAGAAIAALFSSLTQGLLVIDEAALDQVLFWLAGSIQGRKLEALASVWPYLAAAFIICAFLAPKINILTMGEDVARGLGQKTGTVKLFAAAAVILLAGGAVSVSGPISFVGIVIPHLARYLIGNDHRWIIPYSAVLGGILLTVSDIAARYVIMPEEVPVGVMTALIGTPFFIYIARKGFDQA